MYTFECMVLTTIINEVDMQVRIVLLLKRSDGTDDVYFLVITRYMIETVGAVAASIGA